MNPPLQQCVYILWCFNVNHLYVLARIIIPIGFTASLPIAYMRTALNCVFNQLCIVTYMAWTHIKYKCWNLLLCEFIHLRPM